MTIISYKTVKLIKNLIFVSLFAFNISWAKDVFKMQNPYKNTVTLDLALTRSQHTKGLSGLKSNQFSESKGMLFVNPEMGPRRFWMPDTYFNLDIIFLDKDLKIVGIERDVPAHPGMTEPPTIYKTESYSAQFVLETKAKAPFGKKLKLNDQLKFTGSSSLSEIVLKTHPMQ